jgi:hypothetical protein
MTFNAKGNVLNAASVAAAGTNTQQVDASAKFEVQIQVEVVFGTVAATSGVQVDASHRRHHRRDHVHGPLHRVDHQGPILRAADGQVRRQIDESRCHQRGHLLGDDVHGRRHSLGGGG